MSYFAQDLLELFNEKLVTAGMDSVFSTVQNEKYNVLSIIPPPFNPNESDERKNVMMWSVLAVTGDKENVYDQIKLYCKLSKKIPQEDRKKILEYMNYANFSLDFGTFFIDADGNATYKYSYPIVDCGDNDNAIDCLDTVFGSAIFAIKTADMPLQKLISDTVVLDEAKSLLNILLEIINDADKAE